jgi:hypothetical protein
MRVPLSASLLAVLVAGNATLDAIPIAVLAAVTGWLVTMAVDPPPAQAATASTGRAAAAGARETAT